MTRPPAEEVIPRNLYVTTKSDIDKFGHAPLCPGCEAQLMGTGRRAHNPECRFRIESERMKTEEGKQRIEAAKAGIDAGRRPRLQGSEVGLASQRLWKLPTSPRWQVFQSLMPKWPREKLLESHSSELRAVKKKKKKKQKSDARRTKRSSEADIEELHHRQMQDEAAAGAVVDEEGAVVMGPLPSAGSTDPQLQKLHLEAAARWI